MLRILVLVATCLSSLWLTAAADAQADACASQKALLTKTEDKLQKAQDDLSTPRCAGNSKSGCMQTVNLLRDDVKATQQFIQGGCKFKPTPVNLLCTASDSDCDGVNDTAEQTLLMRFRPFYRFSLDGGNPEASHPADAAWFVQHSELMSQHTETGKPEYDNATLAAHPEKIILPFVTNVSDSRTESGWYINLGNPYRGGEPDWNKIMTEGTGLYGHVTPLHEQPGQPSLITAYKLEYWQFYAFNPVPGQIDCYKISDAHEGDWEGVELVVEADQTSIRQTRHNIHSSSAVFEMAKAKLPPKSLAGNIVEYRGPNFTTLAISVYAGGPLGGALAQNNTVRFYCNADGCTHVVVYIEANGHASWPTEFWTWPGVSTHNGADTAHTYLTNAVHNLGEIGKPTPNCIDCLLVTSFNGHWGACGSDPPSGPPLKGTWGRP